MPAGALCRNARALARLHLEGGGGAWRHRGASVTWTAARRRTGPGPAGKQPHSRRWHALACPQSQAFRGPLDSPCWLQCLLLVALSPVGCTTHILPCWHIHPVWYSSGRPPCSAGCGAVSRQHPPIFTTMKTHEPLGAASRVRGAAVCGSSQRGPLQCSAIVDSTPRCSPSAARPGSRPRASGYRVVVDLGKQLAGSMWFMNQMVI